MAYLAALRDGKSRTALVLLRQQLRVADRRCAIVVNYRVRVILPREIQIRFVFGTLRRG